jgi:hypothetical protein
VSDDYDDYGSIDDVYSASELYEMDRDAEARKDAADDEARAAIQAEEAAAGPDDGYYYGLCDGEER